MHKAPIILSCTDALEESIRTQQDKQLAILAHLVTTALRHPFIPLYVHKVFIAPLEQGSLSSVPWALLVENLDSHRHQSVISVYPEHIARNKEFHRLMDCAILDSIA